MLYSGAPFVLFLGTPMSVSIAVSFPKKHKALYHKIKKTKPKKMRLAHWGRELMQVGMDATCASEDSLNGKS